MGFSENAAKRGIINTLQANTPDAAIDWVLSHMDDADLNDPLPNLNNEFKITEEDMEKINQLIAITDCTLNQAKYCLKEFDGDLNNATMWLLDNKDSIPKETKEQFQQEATQVESS